MDTCPVTEADDALSEETVEAPARFTMPASMRDAIVRHLEAALPNEGVGLIGVDPARPGRAVAFYSGTNIDSAPNRYTMEPAEVLAALRAMAVRGLKLGAIVHSHPDSAPTPSATDRREAYYDDVVTVIVQLSPAPPLMRAWRVRLRAATVDVSEVVVVVERDG